MRQGGTPITDPTRPEEERTRLLESERTAQAQLEAVFQAMTDGVMVTDMAGNFLFLNAAQERANTAAKPGKKPGNLADFANLYELSDLDGRPLPYEDWPLSKVLRGESVLNWELWIRQRETGQEWLFSFSGEPVRDPQGRQMLAVLITRDVTEREKRERQLARQAEALRENEERLRLALAIAGMGTFEIDLSTDAVTVNDAGRAIYGWAPDEPLTFAKVQTCFHPDDREEVLRRVEAAFDPAGTGEFEVEQRILRADGAVRWIRVRGRAAFELVDGERRAVRCLGTYLDITDQKEAEREREQLLMAERTARTEAERAARIKDEFLATLGHELRTPLNAILGWSHILASGKVDAGTISKGMAAIERNASSQAKLIDDLLDMSRIITGQIRLDLHPVDLREAIAAAIETVRPAAEAREIRIEQAIDPRAGPVRGDPNRLQQVVWNLLGNAVKFTPRAGTVRVALERSGGHVEVTVADTGQGIAPEFLPFVFDRFRQADGSTTRRHGGLGLGLAIVKQLVELHGGRVRVTSPGEGQGATFVVELPLAGEALSA